MYFEASDGIGYHVSLVMTLINAKSDEKNVLKWISYPLIVFWYFKKGKRFMHNSTDMYKNTTITRKIPKIEEIAYCKLLNSFLTIVKCLIIL